MAIDTQQLENAEKFRSLLLSADGTTKPILLYGGSVEIEDAFKGKLNAEQIAQIKINREAYQAVEAAAAENQPEPEKKKDDTSGQKVNQQVSGAAGGITAIPGAIFAYLDGEDRYSAEKLERKANQRGEKEVKDARNAAKKTGKAFTEEDRAAAEKRGKAAFHEEYVQYHDKRARQLAKDPKNNNPYLKRALFNKDTREAIAKAEAAAKRDKSQKLTSVRSLPPEVRSQIPKTSTIRTVAMGTSQTTTARIGGASAQRTTSSTRAAIPGARNHFSIRSRLGNPISSTANKIMKPLSWLRQNMMLISIGSSLAFVVVFTIFVSFIFFFVDVGGVAGGTSSSSSSGSGSDQAGNSGGTGGSGGGGGETTPTTIVGWAKIIGDNTFVPDGCPPKSSRTRMKAKITNGSYTCKTHNGTCKGVSGDNYLCTQLVKDSYNLFGIKNSFASRAWKMAAGWPWHGGTYLINNSDINQQKYYLQQLQPGDAMFYGCNTNLTSIGHVDIIYSIDPNLDKTGNGRITTIDTNTPTVFGHLTIHNWGFTNLYSTDECSPAKFMWFGQPK